MARKTIRRLIEMPLGGEWERLLGRIRRRDAHRVLILWNRGLGDIALGLVRVVDELRHFIPHAEIAIVTRPDLAEAFSLLPIDRVLVDPEMVRAEQPVMKRVLARIGRVARDFDLVIDRPDPTHWFRGRPVRPPVLRWPHRFDALADRFDAMLAPDGPARPHERARVDIAVHVHSETGSYYSYRKDWPAASWRALFDRLGEGRAIRFVLFGHASDTIFAHPACVDLRGRTGFLEMMAVIRTRCRILIAPDSGILTMAYFVDAAAPIDVVSLWADPRQGVLKLGVASPNPLLRHHPILADDERIERIGVDRVASTVEAILDGVGHAVPIEAPGAASAMSR